MARNHKFEKASKVIIFYKKPILNVPPNLQHLSFAIIRIRL